jgi:DNA-binding MarR family transcriptional regulator
MPEDSSNTLADQPADHQVSSRAEERSTDLGIVDSLVQLSFLVQSVLVRAGAAHELSISQVRLLGIVRDRDAGMMELAAHMGLDKSSVTGLIDRAEKRSLVERSRAPGDGRALRVSITAAGLELVDLVAAAVQDAIATLTDTLTPRQRAQLSVLAGAVVAGVGDPWTPRRSRSRPARAAGPDDV